MLHVIALVFFSMFFRLSISKFCTSLENTERERERERHKCRDDIAVYRSHISYKHTYIYNIYPCIYIYFRYCPPRFSDHHVPHIPHVSHLSGPRNAQRAIVLYCWCQRFLAQTHTRNKHSNKALTSCFLNLYHPHVTCLTGLWFVEASKHFQTVSTFRAKPSFSRARCQRS